jgi:hypothetical protein
VNPVLEAVLLPVRIVILAAMVLSGLVAIYFGARRLGE